MTTIKSYTDIEQSRKLAKILPIESADMIWYGIYRGMDGKIRLLGDEHNELGVIAINEETCKTLFRLGDEYVNWLPCWSLAALLGVLPNKLQIVLAINDFQGNRKEKYVVGSVVHDKYDCYADNPVDACYELILKLHEQNLL